MFASSQNLRRWARAEHTTTRKKEGGGIKAYGTGALRLQRTSTNSTLSKSLSNQVASTPASLALSAARRSIGRYWSKPLVRKQWRYSPPRLMAADWSRPIETTGQTPAGKLRPRKATP